MKYILLITLILSISLAGCNNAAPKDQPQPETQAETGTEATEVAGATWLIDYNQALAQAKDRNLPVLINFSGSDWCGWCIKLMDEVFSKPEFMSYAKDNLVLLNLDFPRKTKLPADQAKANEELAGKYGIQGFPTVILLDANGTQIGQTGYQPGGPEKYITHLKQLINQPK